MVFMLHATSIFFQCLVIVGIIAEPLGLEANASGGAMSNTWKRTTFA